MGLVNHRLPTYGRICSQAVIAMANLKVNISINPFPNYRRAWKKKLNAKDLPWYAQEKLNSGAFSTLAGITFRLTDASSAAFDAIAIGDSCIFQIRGDKIIASFPLGSADDFHNRPVLISSNAANNIHLKAFVKTWSGTAQAGDSFLLMTDALACWLLTRYEEDISVIKKIHGLSR